MDTQLTKDFFDACRKAKHIIKYLPELPKWMTPRQVTVIDAIYQLSHSQAKVRASDVASFLDGTMPSITRMITDLESHGAVQKLPDASDKRVHSLVLTDYGQQLYDYYIKDFHLHITDLFSHIDEQEFRTAIAVLEQTEALLRTDEALRTAPDYSKGVNKLL